MTNNSIWVEPGGECGGSWMLPPDDADEEALALGADPRLVTALRLRAMLDKVKSALETELRREWRAFIADTRIVIEQVTEVPAGIKVEDDVDAFHVAAFQDGALMEDVKPDPDWVPTTRLKRPTFKAAAFLAAQDDDEEKRPEEETRTPLARKRGRPRKNEGNAESPALPPSSAIKRKRGRPRKIQAESVVGIPETMSPDDVAAEETVEFDVSGEDYRAGDVAEYRTERTDGGSGDDAPGSGDAPDERSEAVDVVQTADGTPGEFVVDAEEEKPKVKKKRQVFQRQMCSICGKMLSSPSAMAYHRAKAHGEGDSKALNKKEGGKKVGKRVPCDVCGKTLPDKYTLAQHVAGSHEGKMLPCKVCGKEFTLACNLKKHVLYMHENKRFYCQICGIGRYSASSLRKHILYTHEQKRLNCEHCDKEFSAYSLKSHIERVHLNKKYPCQYCGKELSKREYLKAHVEAIHEGVKFPCRVCGQKFSQPRSLKKHMNVAHSEAPLIPASKSETAIAVASVSASDIVVTQSPMSSSPVGQVLFCDPNDAHYIIELKTTTLPPSTLTTILKIDEDSSTISDA